MPAMQGSIVALVSALIVSVAAPAVADSTTLTDPQGDVYLSQDGPPSGYEPAGSVVNTDLLRTKVKHGKSAVRLALRYQRLARNRSAFISYDAELRVPGGDIFHGLVVVDPSLSSAYVNVTDEDYVTDEDCTTGRVRVRPDVDRVLVRIPRSCLGDPAWVRFGGTALSIAPGKKQKSYLDNALSTGGTVTKRLFAG
jgi:hypothetical protein